MYFTKNDLQNITEERVSSLIENKVIEGKNIEYKIDLKINTYEEKKEFLADVSSFANADGGNLLIGVKEEEGLPICLEGIELDNIDSEKLKIESLLRDCLEPRIQGMIVHSLQLQNSRYLIIIYIPQSFNSPHIVAIQRHWRFYSRNSAGKYQLDLQEVKNAFLRSERIAEKIRNFRIDRISKIKNNDLRISVENDAQFILHIIPLSSVNLHTRIDLPSYERSEIRMDETFYGYKRLFTFDGLLLHNNEGQYKADRYIQIFSNGTLEIFNATFNIEKEKLFHKKLFEYTYIQLIPEYIKLLKFFDLNFPYLIFLTVLNVKDFEFKLGESDMERKLYSKKNEINDLLIPDIILDEDGMDNLALKLKPIFDPIWNACGFPQSQNYNNNGDWIE